MITDIYTPIDDTCQSSLEKIQALLESEALMAGLGQHCAQYPAPSGFPIVADVERSYYLMASQAMWEADAVGEDQYFEEINGEAVDRYEKYEYEEVLKRQAAISNNNGALGDYLVAEIMKIIQKHNVVEHLSSVHTGSTEPQRVKEIVETIYSNSVAGHFMTLAEAAFFGGIQSWPIVNQYYACYQTGGIPTGWVGPLPADGGDPQQCMQLLHYGPQEKA